MKVRSPLLVLGFLLAAGAARADEVVIGRLDINALCRGGDAAVTASPCDIGAVENIFDGNPATIYRSASVNPAEITVQFVSPRTLQHFGVVYTDATTRVRIEAAMDREDLDHQVNTYKVLVDWVTPVSGKLKLLSAVSPFSARVVRLTANRIVGDDYVHLSEWQIFAPTTVTELALTPATATIKEGETQAFAVSGRYTTMAPQEIFPGAVTWSSTDTAIATVDGFGGAVARAPGQATIRATAGSLHADAILRVAAEPTDLDVTFIERTPRYDYDAPKNNPAPGDAVTFGAHVRNWGGADLAGVGYRWDIDGVLAAAGTIPNFSAGTEQVLSLPWTWQDGNHTVSFTIDPDQSVAEASETNNARADRTNGLIVGFWVEQPVYDYFHRHQKDLGLGANSWEDWAQRQVANMNAMFAAAVYPLSSRGVLDRVRLDKIVVVPDGALPLHGGVNWATPDLSDETVDMMLGFPTGDLNPAVEPDTRLTTENPFYLATGVPHDLGHARYLIDSYGFDVHNTYNPQTGQGYDAVQILEDGMPVAGSPLMPFLAFNEVLYYNHSGGIMTGPYGFAWSPYEAAAWNLIAGRRPTCGNYNAPCNIGVYLNDLPANNHVRFVDPQGRPLIGADVRVYRSTGAPIWYGKTFDNVPDLFFTTDARGYAHLPRNPFSSEPIRHWYGYCDSVVILRIRHASGLWYRFMEASDFNMQYWSGHTEDASYTITLPGAVGEEPPTMDDVAHALRRAGGIDAVTPDDLARLEADGVPGIGLVDGALTLRRVLGL